MKFVKRQNWHLARIFVFKTVTKSKIFRSVRQSWYEHNFPHLGFKRILRSYPDFARRGKQNQILSFRHHNLLCNSENEDCPNNDAKLSKFQALEFNFISHANWLSEMKRSLHCSYEATEIFKFKQSQRLF